MVISKTYPCIFVALSLIALIVFSHNHLNNNHHLHLVNRKVSPSKELFDFTPFYQHDYNRFRHHHYNQGSIPDGEEGIDHRFGVQKRLVPTGPNPLHH